MRRETKNKVGGRREPAQYLTVRVPCACGPGGTHPVSITLGQDNCLLSIDAGCELKMGDAVKRLGGESCAVLAKKLWKGVTLTKSGKKRSLGAYPKEGEGFPLLRMAWGEAKEYADEARTWHERTDANGAAPPDGWTFERREAVMDRGGSKAAGFPVSFRIDRGTGEVVMYVEGLATKIASRAKGSRRWRYDEVRLVDLAKRVDPWMVSPDTQLRGYSNHYNTYCVACSLDLGREGKRGSSHVRLVRHQEAVIAAVRRALSILTPRKERWRRG